MSNKIGEIRPSQFISTFGPGSVLELPDYSIIIAGLDEWETQHCIPIQEPRLIRKLGLRKILSLPFPKREGGFGDQLPTIPAFRFPVFHVCPECRKLAPYNYFSVENDGVYCFNNKGKNEEPCRKVKTFPVRFVTACENGHLNDFPWNYYVHNGTNQDCKGDLYLEDTARTGAISDLEVQCMSCKSTRSLQDAFQKEDSKNPLGKCFGSSPWLGKHAQESCDQSPRVLLRGASNLYFSVIESALAIPPYTNPLHSIVASISDRLEKMDSLEMLQMGMDMGFLPELEGQDPVKVWEVLQLQQNLGTGESQDLLRPEWEAIIQGNQNSEEHHFETERQGVPNDFYSLISHLIMVRRLKEVRVLRSFTRISPPPDTTALLSGEGDENEIISYEAPLSKQQLNWRPGVETHGEGIFIGLNENALQQWEDEVESYEDEMNKNYQKYCDDRNIPEDERAAFPGARYILLHTLSHSLMRQLCLNSGYSSSALRERIYSRRGNNPDDCMAGILIYTATPDSEGSLGGLVELGKTENFHNVLWKALDEARLCSSDPLCAEHTPETVGDLNGAACHSCMLASETSCERSNRFLDRSLLVKTVSNQNIHYFK
ncbi:DUF1998 domain-containing protein [Fredinandcohnia onubensis]|uniref:DUF1998 domain-containing protein n=1 Tax=Fredinandcohnia onubensis TaxID=1571209 RepID=UPI000C0BE1C9|nr:DUF1998 domain-containing protein [Fredinandcohnia onubensis]